jgi:hypothetical protein
VVILKLKPMYTLAKITLKNGKPMFHDREVILATIQQSVLVGKGEGHSVYIHKEHLKYRNDDDTDNNQQDAARSIPS